MSDKTAELVGWPDALPFEKAAEGTIVQQWGDMEETGKLYRIESRRNPAQVNVVREDGKKFYMDISSLQLAPANRSFPTLPDYLPRPGDLVHVRGVRGVAPTDVLFVGAVTRGKAKCWILDNSKRSVSLPIGNLSEVTGSVVVNLAP